MVLLHGSVVIGMREDITTGADTIDLSLSDCPKSKNTE